MSLIIFMRHGQAYNNVKKLLVGRNLESHLTDLGREQVKNTSQILTTIDIHKIYSSPVIRTVETAEIVSRTIGVPFEEDERLFEIELGKLVGMYYEDLISKHGNLFVKFYCDNDDENSLLEFEVESFGAVKKRISELLQEVVKKHKNENVLLVSHLDPIKAALSLIMNIKPSSVYNIQIPNASLSIFKNYDNTISLGCINMMDIGRFLSD
ncbi:MAG TPA: histidine phosphatase family protein [Candidatus Sulfopaludibacter sp.]|jgi:2,3-bisphosphoglycerate-dependent phosphoglycerate mutase|nr:histidine phosphatase family protein [Candidatus Sulfopaludibacter sp.]